MTYLAFDTETTGLADFSRGFKDAAQPKLVQLAAILYTDDHKEIASLSTIIQPEGWTIPVAASNVHGITTEIANEQGISLTTALEVFGEFTDIAGSCVAHNAQFDSLIMRHQSYFLNFDGDIFHGKPILCTKDLSTNVLKLPKKSGYGYKWPTLMEAHIYFTGVSFEGAHDALEDTRACARVFQNIKKMGIH